MIGRLMWVMRGLELIVTLCVAAAAVWLVAHNQPPLIVSLVAIGPVWSVIMFVVFMHIRHVVLRDAS